MAEYTTLEAARAGLADMVEDVRGDMGEEAVEAGYSDLVVAAAYDCTDAVALELCRTELGWIPTELQKRLPKQEWEDNF